MKEANDKHKDNSSGIAGLIFGILAVVSGAPGVVFGFVGFWFSLYQNKHGKNRWSKWGIALNIIGFVIGLVAIISLGFLIADNVSNLQGLSELSNYG